MNDEEVLTLGILAGDDLAWLAWLDHCEERDLPKLPPQITNSIGMRFSLIPRCSTLINMECYPKRVVDINPFFMGVYEVTQEEYQNVMNTNPSFFSSNYGRPAQVAWMDTRRFPVDNVSWNDANAFCKNLSELPGEKFGRRAYRLPTEAEWEYACRAGTNTPFHYGNSLSSTQANFNGNHPYGGSPKGPYLNRTCPVGSYLPNAFGLYDMHGNVLEWCDDLFDSHPLGFPVGSARAFRGGSWDSDGNNCISTTRYGLEPEYRNVNLGFRVAISVIQ